MTIDDTTPIAALTVGDFKELMHTLRQQPREEHRPEVRHRRKERKNNKKGKSVGNRIEIGGSR